VISNQTQGGFDSDEGGNSHLGGLRVDLNSSFINEDGTSNSNSDLSHEIGHTGGLIHPFDKADEHVFYSNKFLNFFDVGNNQPSYGQIQGVDLKTNFMSYPQNYINYNTPQGSQQLQQIYLNPGHATKGQIQAILKYYNNGALNRNDK